MVNQSFMDIKKIKKEKDLYNKYYPIIDNYFNKYKYKYDDHSIVEMSNDVFCRLNKYYNKLIGEDNDITKWVYKISKNIRIDHERKLFLENRKKFIINEYYKNETEHYSNILEIMDDDFIMNKEIRQYSDYRNKGFTNKEISKLMNTSERNIYRIVNKFKENVRKKIN